MDEQTWVDQQISTLIQDSSNYPDQAFYRGLRELFTEQYLRLEQLQGELDGRMWSPDQW